MGLLVKPTEEKKIVVQGLDLELDSLYIRVAFQCSLDGKYMESVFQSYKDKVKFTESNNIVTNIQIGNLKTELSDPAKDQNIDTALIVVKSHLESLGYTVELDDELTE